MVLFATLLPLFLGLTTLVYSGPGERWWRSHAGDAFLVAFLVGVLGILTSWSLRFRLAAVATYSIAVELSQLSPDAASRGPISAMALGTHFDGIDFVYYGIGLLLAIGLDRCLATQRDTVSGGR